MDDGSARLQSMIALALVILISVISITVLVRLGLLPEMYRDEPLNNPTTVALMEEIEQKLYSISTYLQKGN